MKPCGHYLKDGADTWCADCLRWAQGERWNAAIDAAIEAVRKAGPLGLMLSRANAVAAIESLRKGE